MSFTSSCLSFDMQDKCYDFASPSNKILFDSVQFFFWQLLSLFCICKTSAMILLLPVTKFCLVVFHFSFGSSCMSCLCLCKTSAVGLVMSNTISFAYPHRILSTYYPLVFCLSMYIAINALSVLRFLNLNFFYKSPSKHTKKKDF